MVEGSLPVVTRPRHRAEQRTESVFFKAEHLDRASIGTVERVLWLHTASRLLWKTEAQVFSLNIKTLMPCHRPFKKTIQSPSTVSSTFNGLVFVFIDTQSKREEKKLSSNCSLKRLQKTTPTVKPVRQVIFMLTKGI